MTLSILQKPKSLVGWYILAHTGWVIPGLLIAGGMLGGQAGIFMLLAAISITWMVFWFGHRISNLPPAGAAAVAETTVQSQKAALPVPKVCQVEAKGLGAQGRRILMGEDGEQVVVIPSGQLSLGLD